MPTIEHPTEWPEAAKAALSRKVGPLPVWGWAAVVVGGIGAYYLISKRSTSTTAASVTNPVTAAVAGGTAGNYGSGGGASTTSSAPADAASVNAGGVSSNAGGTTDTSLTGIGGVATPSPVLYEPNAPSTLDLLPSSVVAQLSPQQTTQLAGANAANPQFNPATKVYQVPAGMTLDQARQSLTSQGATFGSTLLQMPTGEVWALK
jgi:hypothetical protein